MSDNSLEDSFEYVFDAPNVDNFWELEHIDLEWFAADANPVIEIATEDKENHEPPIDLNSSTTNGKQLRYSTEIKIDAKEEAVLREIHENIFHEKPDPIIRKKGKRIPKRKSRRLTLYVDQNESIQSEIIPEESVQTETTEVVVENMVTEMEHVNPGPVINRLNQERPPLPPRCIVKQKPALKKTATVTVAVGPRLLTEERVSNRRLAAPNQPLSSQQNWKIQTLPGKGKPKMMEKNKEVAKTLPRRVLGKTTGDNKNNALVKKNTAAELAIPKNGARGNIKGEGTFKKVEQGVTKNKNARPIWR